MRIGQCYTIKNDLTTGIIEKIDESVVTLRRLTEYNGTIIPKNNPQFIRLDRESVENSIRTGHIMLDGGVDDPNLLFKLRKTNVHS